ncbi:MAG: hypothetical protein LBV27_01255 [Oscillospiraceae bacterium]|jgi:flagellar hook-associated protein 3 FlgL|nr:hypothetical protein [Oscillospiraceae bacterium]
MRISNFTIKRNYQTQLNLNQKNLYDANMTAITKRKFHTMSDDVATGLRAMKARRELSKNASYQNNVQEAKGTLKAAEDVLIKGINSIASDSVFADYQQAANGTMSADERQVVANKLQKMQDALLTDLNSKFSDRYLFGGSQTDQAPFSLDTDGKLMYRGVKVADFDPTDPDHAKLLDDPVYIDIGLGMTLDASGNPIPSTVFDRSISGLDIVGTGEDNMYDVLGQMISSLEADAPDQELFDKMQTCFNRSNTMVTNIGADDNFLDFTQERLTLEEDNLTTRQQGLEFMNDEAALLNLKMAEYAYNAALQIGTRILQPSLFSYMN